MRRGSQPGDLRKRPMQARARETIQIICEAALQLLRVEEVSSLTTVRVARRAGVSVGTLYQYFPDLPALLLHVLQHRLDEISQDIERVCKDSSGLSLQDIVHDVVRSYVDRQRGEAALAASLYRIAWQHGGGTHLSAARSRFIDALAAMLSSSAALPSERLPLASMTFFAVLTGSVRAALETGLDEELWVGWSEDLEHMLVGYLTNIASAGESATASHAVVLKPRAEEGEN